MGSLSCNYFCFLLLVLSVAEIAPPRAEAKKCYNILPNLTPCNLPGCQRLCTFLHEDKGECMTMQPTGEIRCMCSWDYLDADRKECTEELTSLTACLPFVGGDTKVPPPICCFNLRAELNRTQKCLSLLVKESNDPNLGLKINATLALSLPSICHAPANVSKCCEILHLAPNSAEAQDFEDFATPVPDNGSAVVAGTPTSSGNTMRGTKWLEVGIVGLIISALGTVVV